MWKISKLGEICNFEGGSQPPKSAFVYEQKDNYVRFNQIRDFKSDKNKTYIPVSKKNKLCCEDDILIGRYGASVGKILTGLSGAYNVAIMRAIPNKDILNRRYLYLYLSSELFQKPLQEVSQRSAQNGFSKNDIFDFEVPLPTLAEQQSIATKLDAAFAEIDKSILVTQDNSNNAKKCFLKYLNNLFNTKNSRWINTTISEICSIKSGTTIKPGLEKTIGEIPYLKVADMNLKENSIEVKTSSRFLNLKDIRKNSIIESGATIFPKRGGAISTNKKRIITNQICADLNIMSVLPKSKILLPKLLYYYFINIDLSKLGSGSSIPQINNYDIEPLSISFPSEIEEQNKIINKIDKLYIETNKLENIYKSKCMYLKILKNSFLSKYFNESNIIKVA